MAKSTVAKRVPQQSVVVYRDGKQVVPPIGVVFDFTADEVAEIERMNPAAITANAVVDLSAKAPASADL